MASNRTDSVTSNDRPMWVDDDPGDVNAEMVPPALRINETMAQRTQRRSEMLHGLFLVTLVAAPAATFVLRSTDVPDRIGDGVGAVLLLLATAMKIWMTYRAPAGHWIRARRNLETAKSAAWRRAATGDAQPEDSVRCLALSEAPLAQRWACYRTFRISDQLRWFSRRHGEHERAARRLRLLQIGLAAVVLGGAVWQTTEFLQIPLVGLMGSLLGAVEAWSQFRRSGFIAASYAGAIEALQAVPDTLPVDEAALAAAVDTVEARLERELWTWVAITSDEVLTERR